MKEGKIPEIVLTRSVFKNVTSKNKNVSRPEIGGDASWLKGQGKFIYKTSGLVDYADKYVSYYTFYKCYNSMLAAKAVPQSLELTILLPMDAKEKTIKEICKEYDFLCKAHGMTISGGHTQVTDKVKDVAVILCMVGLSQTETIMPQGDVSLVMTKAMGIEGTAIIAHDKEELLRERFNAKFVDDCLKFREYVSIEREAAALLDIEDIVLHDVSGTGIFGAVWEMASRFNRGVSIDIKNINVWQETIELTELFDINPYKMTSQGSLLIACKNPDDIVERLEKSEVPAVVIGRLTDDNDRVVINNDETRYLEPPRGDEIYNIK